MTGFERFIAFIEEKGWNIKKGGSDISLPVQYGWVCREYMDIVKSYDDISSDDGGCFIVLGDVISCSDPDDFSWDTFQNMSILSVDDEEERADIAAWWDDHFPIIMSENGGYSFYAISRNGSIVYGREPYFEEASPVADSLEDFWNKVADGKIFLF